MNQSGTVQHGKRRTHRKVRTGCITCKIRRVKCDEEKPNCRRCRSTGRKCDGYADIESTDGLYVKTQSRSPSDDDKTAIIHSSIAKSPARSGKGSRSLEYFHAKTLPTVSGFIDTGLWSRLLLQLGEGEPAINSAISAFSSFHELVETHGMDRVGGKEVPEEDSYALQHYTKAISQLRDRLSSGPASKTITLVCCMIFTCLDFLRGDRETALAHLKSGMNILRLQPREQDSQSNELVDECLAPAFSRMSLLSTIYGQPRENRYIDLLTVSEPELPLEFTNLEAARISMFNTTNSVMALAYMMDFSLFASAADAKAAQIGVTEGIEQWMVAFAPLLDKKGIDQRGAYLLRSIMTLAKIWISRYLRAKHECAFDDFLDEFRELIAGMEIVLADGIEERLGAFTVDTGMISTLYFTANKCRDRLLRRRAVELMRKCPRREGLYDSSELSQVAEFIIEVEEEDLPSLPCENLPAEEKRVSDYRISRQPKSYPQKVDVDLHHGLVNEPGTLLAKRTLVLGDDSNS